MGESLTHVRSGRLQNDANVGLTEFLCEQMGFGATNNGQLQGMSSFRLHFFLQPNKGGYDVRAVHVNNKRNDTLAIYISATTPKIPALSKESGTHMKYFFEPQLLCCMRP